MVLQSCTHAGLTCQYELNSPCLSRHLLVSVTATNSQGVCLCFLHACQTNHEQQRSSPINNLKPTLVTVLQAGTSKHSCSASVIYLPTNTTYVIITTYVILPTCICYLSELNLSEENIVYLQHADDRRQACYLRYSFAPFSILLL